MLVSFVYMKEASFVIGKKSVAVLVPVTLGVLVESGEHDRQDLGSVVTDQAHDVLIVPVIQCSFSDL